jgi:hypothetical protein
MEEQIEKLRDGTLVQHKVEGYRGRINGITGIKSCFTRRGALVGTNTKETFQYRVAVAGEPMRHIAPAEDLEILEEEQSAKVLCFSCQSIFVSKPGKSNKPAGRCECGGWICPACLVCQPTSEEGAATRCKKQRSRLIRKQAKKTKSVETEVDRPE